MADYNSQYGGADIDLYLREGHEAKAAVDQIMAGIGNYVQLTDEASLTKSGVMTAADKIALDNAAGGQIVYQAVDTLNAKAKQGLWRLGENKDKTKGKDYGYILVLGDYGGNIHQYYFGALDPAKWQTPSDGKQANIYTRLYRNGTWTDWQRYSGNDDEIIKLIKGTSENSSAMEYPQVYKDYQATKFADPVAEAMAHMDSIGNTTNGSQESKNVGVTVLNVNGNCWRLNTFVQSYASQVYVQKIEGALQWDGEKFVSSSDYHEYTRKRTSAGWGMWEDSANAALRPLYIAAGAVYNTSTGFYELNGLTDITDVQMANIYNYSCANRNLESAADLFRGANIRTNIPPTSGVYQASLNAAYMNNGQLEVVRLGKNEWDVAQLRNATYAFSNCTKLKEIQIPIDCTLGPDFTKAFEKCNMLESVKIKGLKSNISFRDCSQLNYNSLKYLVDNAANTSAIDVTVNTVTYNVLLGGPSQWKALYNLALSKYIRFVKD